MKKKVIIFDFDGVLFDSPKLVNDFFLYSYPTMTQEVMNEILCGNFHEELTKFKLTNKPREETPEEKKIRVDAYTAAKQRIPLYKGIQEMLNRLHDVGYILVVNTSALEKNCLPLLEYSKITNLFDFVVTKETSTSKTEKFKIIMQKYNIKEQEMFFITDTLGDVREAEVANVPTVAVTWGAHNKSYFTREPHDNLVAIVDSASELEEFIKSS